jgi:DNA-binding NarL/FixJ family response regulator
MPDLDGVTALGRIKAELPDLRVLMLSTYDNPAFVARAVAFGAGGYVLKTLGRDQLLEAMLSVSAGKDLWTQTDMRRISGALGTPRIRNLVEAPLTAREAEVLECVSRGLTNKEIAHELGISNETVKEHVQHTLSKLGLSDRTQAAVWAIRNGVVA